MKLSKKFFHRQESGATMVEFALVAPIFFLVIFFFFEMARYMYLYSVINAGADAGAQFAAQVTGFDEISSSEGYAEAELATKSKARATAAMAIPATIGSGTVLSEPEIILPQATAARTQDEAFAQDPIRVVMQAEVRPVLSMFPSLPIRVIGQAFRERTKVPSIAVPVDCNGNPQGSSRYNNEPCPCSEERYWDGDECVCKWSWINSTDCSCPEPAIATTDYWWCTCPDASALGCGANTVRSETWNYSTSPATISCSCVCKAGFVPNGEKSCGCPAGKVDQNGACVCSGSCTDGKIMNSSDCTCACPPGSVTLANGQCGCSNANYRFQAGSGCVCNLTAASCTGGSVFSAANCSCSCPAGKISSGDSCVCPAPQIDNGSGGCMCPPSITCGPNMKVDPASCGCVCNTGYVSDGAGSCGCPTNKVQSGSSCVCSSAVTCPAPQVVDSSSCGCKCPSTACGNGGSFNGSSCECICPSGKTFNGSQCVCSSGCGANMTQNSSTCACSCNNGLIMYNGQCMTNSCQSMLLAGQDCNVRADGSCVCGEG